MWRSALVATLIVISGGEFSFAQTPGPHAAFSGSWKAIERVGGLTAVTFGADGTVEVWGQCAPKDCEWGITKFTVLPPDDRKLTERGFATNPNGRYLVFRLEGNELVVELNTAPELQSARGFPRAHYGIHRFLREPPKLELQGRD
jgi:hypothetical protein